MSLIKDLMAVPQTLPSASKYTVLNGFVYLATGLMLILWPAAVQQLFMDPAFTGHEAGLVRAIGLAVAVIGWLYVFAGRSGSRQMVAATVIDRLVFVPIVLVPLALQGVFPHVLLTFAILDPTLALIAWIMLSRSA